MKAYPYPEYSVVKTLVPVDVNEDGDIYHLPTGTLGTIVDISGKDMKGASWYTVEFELTPIRYDADGEVVEWPEEGITGVRHEHLELVQAM